MTDAIPSRAATVLAAEYGDHPDVVRLLSMRGKISAVEFDGRAHRLLAMLALDRPGHSEDTPSPEAQS